MSYVFVKLTAQDEVKFYMGDAASKLLLVPARGNREAEKAAAELNVPSATISVSRSEGALQPVSILFRVLVMFFHFFHVPRSYVGRPPSAADSVKCRGEHLNKCSAHTLADRSSFHGV